MNISLNNSNALSGVLKIEIGKSDYEGSMEKSLRELRRKANMPGFRKGMVPMSMVKKMYGVHVLAEELNRIVAKSMSDYITENNVNILGEPVPSETEQKQPDLENDENFEFSFDLAYCPEVDIALSKEDKLAFYKIKVDDESIDKQIDSYTASYGTYELAEKSEAEDMLKGLLVELADSGEPDPEGVLIENAIVQPVYMKGKMEQKKFVGAHAGKKIIFNPFKAYKGSEAEIASLLRIDAEKAKTVKSDFSFEIKEITRTKKAELNQELYDKIYGEGAVKDETEFRERTKNFLAEQYEPECKYKFIGDFHELMLEKTKNVIFADDILKRWLLLSNEDKPKEALEKEYPLIADGLKYQLAKNKLLQEFGIKIDDNDVRAIAERATRAQFAQYGMLSVPDNLLDNYVSKMLEKQETVNSLVERAAEEKLVEAVREKISIEEKEVTPSEFFNTAAKDAVKENED